MTLTELRYIVALHDTGHFGRAAEKCAVSQPTLSIAVRKLEDELGVALFERSRSQVKATPIGERILRQAHTVLEQAGRIKELADEGRDPLGSRLSVGAIYTVGPYLFPCFVPQLQRLAPDMPLYIVESYTGVLREKLRASELDTIIVALPFTEPDVVTQPLYDEPFVVLMPADHPLAAEKAIDPARLEQETILLLGEGHCFRDQVLEACPGLLKGMGKATEQLRSVVEGGSLETLKHMVASRLGLTVLPRSAAGIDQYGGGLVTRPFVAPAPKRTVALAWRASFPRHQAIDVISEAIR
ncbi:MAG TPA: LysR substrate-binding domain-containing protein, partial [Spongiibacteraceae bacterium]|nr:LysR substrate-binding domain-containing protein [Spongiibacteraceae bacterium]